MTLRFAAILLILFGCTSLRAADEPGSESLAGHPSETSSRRVHSIQFGTTHRLGKLVITLDNGARIQERDAGPGGSKADNQFADKLHSLFQDQSREFPFSPRLIRQSNYDIEITDEPLLSEEFRVMQECNAARRFGLPARVPPNPTASSLIVEADGPAAGVDLILTEATDGVLQLTPVVTADAESTGGGAPPACAEQPQLSILADCEGQGACFRRVASDDEPIDVVLADCDEDCTSRATLKDGDAECLEAATAHVPELPPGLPPGEVQPPSFAEIQRLLPIPQHTLQRYFPRPFGALPPPPGRLDSGFRNFTLSAHPVESSEAATPEESGTSIETCSHPEPPLKVKVEHLLEAARHLAGAGYEEEAKLFRVEAEAIQRASTRLLTEKRQELERLQREIAELELLTGQYDLIQLDFRIFELTLPADCDTQACSALYQPGIHVFTSAGGSTILPPCGAESEFNVADVLRGLATCPSRPVQVFAPKIVTTNGRTAMISNGGSIVVPVSSEVRSDAKPATSTDLRKYGIELQALPITLGNDKVRLNLVAEISERDFSNAVNLNGTAVPGLTTRRCNTTVETRFGDVAAISFNPARTSGAERKCMLLLVTPSRVAPLHQPAPAN